MATLMQQINQGTFNPDSGRVRWTPYFDSISFLSTTLSYSFFATPLGQGGKTLSQTNFRQANVFPANEKMEVVALEAFFIPDAAKTQAQLQHVIDAFKNSVLTFDIGGVNQLTLPMTQFMKASFPVVVTGAAAGDQISHRTSYNAVWELPVEIILAAKTDFAVALTFTTAPNASLDGDVLLLSMVGPIMSLST